MLCLMQFLEMEIDDSQAQEAQSMGVLQTVILLTLRTMFKLLQIFKIYY